jgi:hypothetical protein
MRAEGLLERLAGMSAAAQASVPAVYAWGVTVAPVAWSRGASPLAKVAAVVALAAVGLGIAGERRWGARARVPALWGFVLACGVAWSAAPAALGPFRVDTPRGIAGMLGWALFAFASAAPALGARPEDDRLALEGSLSPRKTLSRGDASYVAIGAVIAALLQTVGWRVASVERALLVRVVSLAAGIAVLGVATDVARARHTPRAPRPSSRRLRGAMVALVALGLLALTGLLLAFRD